MTDHGPTDEELAALLRSHGPPRGDCTLPDGPDFDAISTLRSGTLAPEVAANLEAHLIECHECRELERHHGLMASQDALAGLSPETIEAQEAALIAGLGSRLEPIANGLSPRAVRPARRRARATAWAAAIAAGVAALISWPRAQVPQLEVRGTGRPLAEVRGAGDPSGDRFGENSRLSFEIDATLSQEGEEPILRVFVEEPSGKLKRVHPSIRSTPHDNGVRLFVEGEAKRMAGTDAGRKTFWFCAAFDPSAFAGLDGGHVRAIQERSKLSCTPSSIQYDPRPGAAKEAQLHNHLGIALVDDRPLYFFDEMRLPRIGVLGVDESEVSVILRDDRGSHPVRTRLDRRGPWSLLDVDGAWPAAQDAVLVVREGAEILGEWRVVWRPSQHPAYASELSDIRALIVSGQSAFREGRWAEAAAFFEKASERAEAAKLYSEAAHPLRALAYVQMERGNLDGAEALMARSRGLEAQIDNHAGLAECDYFDGLIHVRRGFTADLVRARILLERAVEAAWARGDDTYRDAIVQALANLFADHGASVQAVELLRRYPVEQTRAPIHRGVYFANLASALRVAKASGELDVPVEEIFDAGNRAVAAYSESGTRQFEAAIRATLSRAALDSDQLDAAREHLEALRGMPSEEVLQVRWAPRLLAAELMFREGRLSEAADSLRSVERDILASRGGIDSSEAWSASALLAETELARGRDEVARELYRGAVRRANELRRLQSYPRAGSAFHVDHDRVFRGALRSLLDAKQEVDAFEMVENQRAAALLEIEVRARTETAKTEWAAYQVVRQELVAALSERCSSPATADVEHCRALELRAVSTLGDFYAKLLGGEGEVPQLRAADLMRRLPEDRAMVSVARLDEGWVAFLVTRHEVTSSKGEAPWEVWGDKLRSFRHVYLSPGESREAFGRISAISSAGAGTTGPTLSLVPHGGVVARPRQSANGAKGGLVVAADPSADLAQAAWEGEQVAGRVPGAILLEQQSATVDAVSSSLAHAAAFHFAGHGTLTGRDPWSARLLLADGALGLHDLLMLEIPGLELVVLSGCETGRVIHDGSTGLPQALLMRGTRTVLATGDNLADSDQTRAFIEDFYDAGGLSEPGPAFQFASHRAPASVRASYRLWGEP